ncbi:MAG TPA: hypothetical protein VF765_13435 [Polyangiaceae bacterium]
MDHQALMDAFSDAGAEAFHVSIVLVVDQSGSMKPFASAVPDAFDRFVASLREGGAAESSRLAVITDGKDTSSTPEGRWELQSLSLRAQTREWTLLTFGIGTDGRVAARSLGFPDDAESAQTLARSADSLFESLAVVSSRSIPPGASGVVRRRP